MTWMAFFTVFMTWNWRWQHHKKTRNIRNRILHLLRLSPKNKFDLLSTIFLSLSLSSRIMILTSKQLFHYLYWTSFANNYEQLAHRKLPNSFWTHICTFSPWKRGKTKEMVWDLPIPSPWLVDQIFCFHLVARPNLVVIKGKQEGGTPIKKSRLGSIVIFWKYLVEMNVISDLEFWS